MASILLIQNCHNTNAPASQHVKEYHTASGDGRKCRAVPHEGAASDCAGGHACRSIFRGRHRRLKHRKQILRRLPGRKKPTASSVSAAPVSLVACSPMTTLESDITNNKDLICPPPKRLRTRKTAPAAMRDRVEDLKQKRHFSTAHKEATRLFAQECE